MLQDLARAGRSWLRTPRLTLAIVACIAVSIAGASTVLTFAYSLLWRPLPFPEASRLVLLQPRSRDRSPGARPYLSYPDFADLRSAAASFEILGGATVSRLIVVTANGAERLRGEVVTPGYFGLFGLTPRIGRAFTDHEYAGRGERAILISTRLWRSHFAGREDLVGQSIETRAGKAVVIGIMPEGYLGVAEDEGTDYWLAERQTNHPTLLTERTEPTTLVFGRLKSGITIAAAEGEIQSLLARIATEHPANRELGGTLQAFGEKWRADLRPGLATMLVASLFLLGIGCGNVAILLLARMVTREREIAVRLSIGATRRDLVRLMGAEGLLLAFAGGSLGIWLSFGLGDIFRRVAGLALPTHLPVAFGLAPLALCAGVVLLTGAAFTFLPAMVASQVDSASALRTGGRGVASSALQGRGGRLLVIGQTALAVVLLAGAALFLRSYDKLRFVDTGFRTANLLRYQISLPRERYSTPDAVDAFYRGLTPELRAVPGVRGLAYLAPTLPPYDANEIEARVKGQETRARSGIRINQHFATNEAFDILRVPLREGRLFGPEDRRGGTTAGLVSATLARAIAPEGTAIGRVLSLDGGIDAVIVGVVADARWSGLRNRRPSGLNLFLSLDQFPQASVGVLFDTSVNPRSLIDPVRRVVVSRDPATALHWIDTMDEALDFQTVSERFWTFLATAYAGTAVLLAVLGLYGILTHGVVSRAREIGVRLALGATSGAVARFITLEGVRLVSLGLSAGFFLVLLLGRLIRSRLYETSVVDPVALATVLVGLLAVGAMTAWLPARRAARISPLTALRSE